MSSPSLRHPLAVVALVILATVAAVAPASAAGASCDRYAAPFGSDSAAGTEAFPLRTAQRLADALTPGQTGCLMSGTYTDEISGPYVLRVNHGGRAGAPITIRSVPGQLATLRGIVYVPRGSDSVVLSDLGFDARRATVDKTVGIQVMAADTIFERNDVTNHTAAICMVLGAPGWGQAVRTVVRGNTFHDCGGTTNYLEHSLYIEWSEGVLVTDNLFLRSGAYAIHFYPSAHQTMVSHNVMAGNGGGVIFAGEGDSASSDNTVQDNVITGSYRRPGIHSWWGGAVGSGNLARSNCLYGNPKTNVDVSGGGFTSTANSIANPGYVNPGGGDYRLAAGSPCLSIVGYDTAAKLRGEPAPAQAPAPAPAAAPPPMRDAAAPEPPEATVPASDEATAPAPGPNVKPVESARLAVDDGAFSASGGGEDCSQPGSRIARARCRAAARR